MKRIIKYTDYEGKSVIQTFISNNIDSLDAQEYELDKFYREKCGIGGFKKEIILDESDKFFKV